MIEEPRSGDRAIATGEHPLPCHPAFLRFDPPELQDGSMVVRAVPADLRDRRRHAHGTPLAYLYEVVSPGEPEHDLTFSAGHFDEAGLVWRFSGEVTGIGGITEPAATPPPEPAEPAEAEPSGPGEPPKPS